MILLNFILRRMRMIAEQLGSFIRYWDRERQIT
jgi:hypothetical protein